MRKDNTKLKFTKNCCASWFSLGWLKISKCSISLTRLGKCSKSKVRPLWYKPLLLLSSTYWPFLLFKILNSSYSRSRVVRMCHFWAQNGPFPPLPHPTKIFFFWGGGIINIILIYLLAPFILQNFKKILPSDPELWGSAIFRPKMAHFPKWEFF